MSEEARARLKKVRGGHRASATRTLAKANDTLAETSKDVSKLKQLKLALENKADTLKKLDEEVLEKTPDDELDEEIQQADMFAEDIQLAIVQLSSALEEVETAGSHANGGTPTSRRTPSTSPPPAPLEFSVPRVRTDPVTTYGSGTTKVKLPKLSLKRFNGDMSKWMSFWDSFNSTAHQNPVLSNIDKFNYLSSVLCIRGDSWSLDHSI